MTLRIDTCLRTHSDFFKYQHANLRIIFATIAIWSFLTLFCVLVHRLHRYRSRDALVARSRQHQSEQTVSLLNSQIDPTIATRYRLDDYIVTVHDPRHHSPESQLHETCRNRVFNWCFIATIIGFAVLGCIAVVKLPSSPDYSLCSHKTAWVPVIRGLLNKNLNVEMQLQLSVYNPNRFDIDIYSLSTAMKFRNEVVAISDVVQSVHIDAGSINDVMVNLKFNATLKMAAFIAAEYATGRLLIDVDINVDSNLSFWSNFVNSGGEYKLENIDVISQPIHDRKYCKCI